jgi:excisionase family DNA binding protein
LSCVVGFVVSSANSCRLWLGERVASSNSTGEATTDKPKPIGVSSVVATPDKEVNDGHKERQAGVNLEVTLNDDQLDEIARRAAALQPATASPWLDTKGAAEYVACTPDRIHDLVGLRKLTPRRDGRRLLFKRDDLDAYLESSLSA